MVSTPHLLNFIRVLKGYCLQQAYLFTALVSGIYRQVLAYSWAPALLQWGSWASHIHWHGRLKENWSLRLISVRSGYLKASCWIQTRRAKICGEMSNVCWKLVNKCISLICWVSSALCCSCFQFQPTAIPVGDIIIECILRSLKISMISTSVDKDANRGTGLECWSKKLAFNDVKSFASSTQRS